MARNSKTMLTRKSHQDLVNEWLRDPSVRAEYDALEDEFQLLREIVIAKKRAKCTQAEIARHMGTHASAVTRLESSLGNGKHSPSLNTLRKYAKALGCKVEIRFKALPREKSTD